ncbi:MAG: hypothetical protein JKY61_09235, partial [Planctomycetes bacterium]|nr:hypothetical protein [Planctomycetota bacterium]
MRTLSKATSCAIFLLAPLFCGSTFAAAAAPSGSQPVLVQDEDEDEVPDKREEVKNLLADLKGQIRKRGKQDKDAISTIETLMGEFEASGPKDRKSIVKGIVDCYKQKRTYSEEEGYDNSLYMA